MLKQKLKLNNNECVFCKETMNKILFSSDKEDTLLSNHKTIMDPDYDIYYENAICKKYIQQHLGFYCQICMKNKNEIKKFGALKALEDHYDKFHHLHHCNLCVEEKPVLLFE